MASKNIFLCGHEGFIGSAILEGLKKRGYKKIIVATRRELDLTNQSKTIKFFKTRKFNHKQENNCCSGKSWRDKSQFSISSRFYISKLSNTKQYNSSFFY